MSAAAQPNPYDPRTTQPDGDKNVSGLFSSVLRDAAFVSSTGRVYRLFPEGEEVSLGRTFALEAFQEPFREPESAIPDFTLSEHPRSAEVSVPEISPAAQAAPERPIEETIKRKRAVEGICGRYQTTRPVRIFQSLSEKIRLKTNPSAKAQTDSFQTRKTKESTEECSAESATEKREVRSTECGETSSYNFVTKFPASPAPKGHAGSPLSREISIRGYSLFEKKSADDHRSIFRCEIIPFLGETPDFFEKISSPAPERKTGVVEEAAPSRDVPPSPMPVAADALDELLNEPRKAPVLSAMFVNTEIRTSRTEIRKTDAEVEREIEFEQKVETVEETEPLSPIAVQILRMEIPAVIRRRPFRRPFGKAHSFVRHEAREDEVEPSTILLHPILENPVPEASFQEEIIVREDSVVVVESGGVETTESILLPPRPLIDIELPEPTHSMGTVETWETVELRELPTVPLLIKEPEPAPPVEQTVLLEQVSEEHRPEKAVETVSIETISVETVSIEDVTVEAVEIRETTLEASEEAPAKFVPYLHLGDAHVPPIEWSNWKPRWPEHIDSMKHRAGESIRLLSDHLVALHQQDVRIVSFNGFHPGDGCTTVILCAARQLAARGFRILLADAHAENPEIPRLLDIPCHPTFYEVVLLEEHLEFLPWSETAIDIEQDGRIESRHFGELVAMIRDEFDLVLVDNGSLIEQPLAERKKLWQEMGSDGVLLVVNRQHCESVNLPAIAAKLRQHEVELLGITENYVRTYEPGTIHEPGTVSTDPAVL